MSEPKIIAENKGLIAIYKPAGLIVHSDGRTVEPSLANWLLEKYRELEGVGEPWVSPQGESIAVAGIVHRLDRSTSGVMLVGKTPRTFAYLKNEFKERRVEKLYHALVYGHMEEDEGEIVAEIMRTSEVPKKWYARPTEVSDPRAAITKWEVLRRFTDEHGEKVTYVEMRPVTGRTHQIRVHFASIGHPLIADHLYAADRAPLFGFKRPALHAESISVTLPDGKKQTYSAPIPDDFHVALLADELYS